MSVERLPTSPARSVTPLERADRMSTALSDAARRLRFANRGKRAYAGGGFRARRGERLFRFLLWASFLVVFVLPSLASIVYYGWLAVDQYDSEARFTVRGGVPPRPDSIASLTGLPSTQIVQDTQVVVNYVKSRPLLEALEKRLDIRAMYSRGEVDWYARLGPDQPIEKFLRYWRSMIDVSIQMPGGIVVLGVRAFTPEDAARITETIVDLSDELVNAMNDRIRSDAVALSTEELRRAGEELKRARVALEKARNEEGILDAGRSADALTGLIASVQQTQIRLQAQFDSSRKFVAADAPQMKELRAKIGAANEQLAQLKARLTTQNGTVGQEVLSASMTKLAALDLERKVAEQHYDTAATSLERARIASETKLLYLDPFVRPVAAQHARFPKRENNIAAVVIVSFIAWGALAGMAAAIRNNMA